MERITTKILINAAAIWIATKIIKGIQLTDSMITDRLVTLLLVALIFGVVNTIIKPVVKLFTLPLFILTLGLITLLVNGIMLILTSNLAGAFDLGFQITGLWAATLGALVISIVSFLLNVLVPDE
jgi:putative membrane protein